MIHCTKLGKPISLLSRDSFSLLFKVKNLKIEKKNSWDKRSQNISSLHNPNDTSTPNSFFGVIYSLCGIGIKLRSFYSLLLLPHPTSILNIMNISKMKHFFAL